MKLYVVLLLSYFEIAVASPPDRRVTRDDIGVASAGVTVNNAAVTGCSSASGAASSKSRNPSSSPGRNGQLSSKFSEIRSWNLLGYLISTACTLTQRIHLCICASIISTHVHQQSSTISLCSNMSYTYKLFDRTIVYVTNKKSVSESLLIEKKILFLEEMYVCE